MADLRQVQSGAQGIGMTIENVSVVVAVIVLAALPFIMFIAERNRQRDEQASEFTADEMPTDDPIAAECMARAANSGKIVFAKVGEDGQVEFSES